MRISSFIRAVLGRVRELIDTYAARGVRFFAPDVAFTDAEKYVPPLLKKRGKKADDLAGALGYLRELIEPIGPDVYAVFESEARLRLRGRDETDWPVLACALGLACGIWTEDARFLWNRYRSLDHKSHRDLPQGTGNASGT